MLSLEQPADAQPQRRARRPAAGLIFLAAVVAIIALIGIFLIVIQGTRMPRSFKRSALETNR